ncbi:MULTISPECIES: discoidin domain-containing protein [Aliiglaciecola]|uniref:discoidin domain-containing protein n=1 Tax=Aliiglaciecola TaxID=1406885 RepID=UPI001C0A4E39|nr:MULTISPECIES: discoidin domain-containing protein [Aliiglaciecola]MBU2877773.1 discoidin domain-containing protein [Aliiglaciecola lipolytica]MDO6709137.1 discoidin domain-containing protein [Aliiglaciecola sp. 2_MG-2023]MDO6750285.1 discoidin domain-containing protein [Aliiglaciecola sp. 1_MG-2023]
MFFRKKATSSDTPVEDEQKILNEVSSYLANNPLREFKGVKSNDPLVIETSNKARFIRLSLQVESSFHLDAIEIFNQAGRNVAPNKNTIISSTYNDEEKYNGQGAINGKKNGGAGFHTKREHNPWLVIDLGSIRNLAKIVVYNREGEFFTRALSLKVETSRDLRHWHLVHDNWGFIKTYKDGSLSEFEQALLHAGILNPGPPAAYLKKLKNLEQDEKALSFHRLINQLVKSKGVAFGPHGFMKTFDLKTDAEKNKVFRELSILLKWLNEEFGVPAFVSSGTLLGLVRDGKLIGHDDDVDICYISKEQGEQAILEERKRLVAFLTEKGCRLSPSGIAHYWCTTPGGLNLDIFTGFTEEGKCSMNPIGRKEVPIDAVLPLSKQSINGNILYFPQNPEPLLVLNYGDNWRNPDPLWTFNWGKAKQDFAFLYF